MPPGSAASPQAAAVPGAAEVAPAAEAGLAGRALAFVRSLLELPGEASRIQPLEGARGIAVILVFFVHYHAAFGAELPRTQAPGWVAHWLATAGHLGVDLFFVMSGFLIYGALLRRPTGYVAFMRRRIRRIYPAFLAVLGLYLALSLLVPSHSKLPADGLPLYLVRSVLLLPGVERVDPVVTVTWSLSFELWYYVALPLVVGAAAAVGFGTRGRLILLGGLAVLYMAVGDPPGFWFGPFLMFLPGMWLHERLGGEADAERWRLASWMAVLLTAVAVTFTLWSEARHLDDPAVARFPGWHGFQRMLTIGVPFALLLGTAMAERGPLRRALTWAPLRLFGNMSYSYYLLHGLAINATALLVHRLDPAFGASAGAYWSFMPLAFLVTAVASLALFVWVERPLSLARPGRG